MVFVSVSGNEKFMLILPFQILINFWINEKNSIFSLHISENVINWFPMYVDLSWKCPDTIQKR